MSKARITLTPCYLSFSSSFLNENNSESSGLILNNCYIRINPVETNVESIALIFSQEILIFMISYSENDIN